MKRLRMATISPSDKAKEEIIGQYNRDPRNWKIYVGRDKHAHYDVMVVHPSGTWFIKEHEINPFKTVGLAARTEVIDIKADLPTIEFGLRSIKKELMERIFATSPDSENLKQLILQALKTEPSPTNKIQEGPVLQGPVLYTPQSTELLSQRHEKLKKQLQNELEKLLLKHYPQTIIPYL